jgi:endoglucanase
VQQIASQPTAIWLGDWYSDALLTSIVKRHAAAARQQGTTLVLVTYAIPNRDCGGYSAGGHGYDTYLAWNRTIVAALGGTRAVVLVEPDSLSMLASPKCAGEAVKRLPLIRGAVDILRAAGNRTYLDGGNSNWLTPSAQADWLTQAGIAAADGFFTNVSNFYPVQAEQDYAGKVSSRVGWKHFVIDVSRNGRGWLGTWCNPPGAGLGANPTAKTGAVKLDALLWVKHPGLSDGTCNGGPAAGSWFESYALSLVRNR